jgi:type IV pilus assembly protein PilW
MLVALAVASLLLLGLVQIASATSASVRLQDSQAQLQDRARFAAGTIAQAIREAGFNPRPWEASMALEALPDSNRDGAMGGNDRLVVRSWSDRNCFHNRNPVSDDEGRPLAYLREVLFDLNSSGNLSHRCRYGPSLADLTEQVRRQGLIQGVESFQLLFGLDADRDGFIEQWVRAGEWPEPARVLAVRAGLLLAADQPTVEKRANSFRVLDTAGTAPADGRLRRVFELTVGLRGHPP